MRRAIATAVLAAGFALSAAGCGVQPTGVNVSKVEPFSVAESSKPPSSLPSEKLYPVQLVLFPTGSSFPKEYTCYLPAAPKSAIDLAPMLAAATSEECGADISTFVPLGLRLQKTGNAHEYRVLYPDYLHPFAQLQLVCTFDRFWIDHPDPNNNSTQFLLPDSRTGWQDCLYLLGNSLDSKMSAALPNPVPSGN
ncbi:MAG: hypothetical protein HOV87_27005 [Catenulispora sp.]|nr:hypothetical protein [Catenulispora sp.]